VTLFFFPLQRSQAPGDGYVYDALAVDEIDTVLAGHYGFTEEELNFIPNYDIKYRLGRDTEGQED
jgi:hypothetical protein